mmetsp:Transcript_34047/g.62252  ORF Transcript_34047/g.62252 Transcript_34047/m.62252 type:complete len:128 (+) Transcript_34047:41-424(+)
MSEGKPPPQKRARDTDKPGGDRGDKFKAPDTVISKNVTRKIMKMDDGVKHISPEALFLVTKATEVFVAKMAQQSFQQVQRNSDSGARSSGRLSVGYAELVGTCEKDDTLVFLKHVLPSDKHEYANAD